MFVYFDLLSTWPTAAVARGHGPSTLALPQQLSGGPSEAHVLQQLSVGLIGSLVFTADVPDDAEAL